MTRVYLVTVATREDVSHSAHASLAAANFFMRAERERFESLGVQVMVTVQPLEVRV